MININSKFIYNKIICIFFEGAFLNIFFGHIGYNYINDVTNNVLITIMCLSYIRTFISLNFISNYTDNFGREFSNYYDLKSWEKIFDSYSIKCFIKISINILIYVLIISFSLTSEPNYSTLTLIYLYFIVIYTLSKKFIVLIIFIKHCGCPPVNEEIAQIPIHFYPIENQNEVCSICMDEANNDLWVEIPCKHKYHLNCIRNWLNSNNNCPVCRSNL